MKFNKTVLNVAFVWMATASFAQMTGNDQDAHGCKASAGYTYSMIKKECIRVFEQDIKLEEVNPGSSASICAVIFSSDNKKAEIFAPGLKGSSLVLARKKKADVWKKGEYELVKANGAYILKKNGTEVFKQG